ncbi:hypothetical protein RHGRI_002094 [Rhododendron griersonianum]|uniref:U3 small nucleolar RNA-associated protein 25 n=1 Tax=Rhododendron griersonianum TaxID=479676 RepID=A0AAV6LQV3_9ERIC|nr:hypothetical protein RHGRI_002094 [Rhododendron griersonianum]
MGKQSFGRKQGFKRLKPHKESGKTRKNRRTKDEIEHRPSPSDSGDSSEEHSNAASEEEEAAAAEEEEVAYREPTMYDHLLKTLSGSKSFAKAYKKRQREEEGKSDTEEDSGSELESFSASEEEDDSNEGSLDLKSNPQGSDLVGEHSDNVGDEDEGCSDIDEARDLEVNGHSALEVYVSICGDSRKLSYKVYLWFSSCSSFSDHLGYKLSETECDNLSKRKWKYKWEIPASDMPNSKWMGTGDCLTKDVDLSSGYSLKLRLYKHWLHIYEASGGNDFHLSRQRNFFSLFNSYRDILHHSKKPFYLKGVEEDSNVMDAYLMHSLNHIFRTGDLVTKNNAKVAKHQERADELLNGDGFLDQGFTRPKVDTAWRSSSLTFEYGDLGDTPEVLHAMSLTVKLTKPVLSNIMSCAYSLVTLDPKAGVVDQIKVFVTNLVLILLPLASIAFRVIKRLIQLTPPTHKVNVESLDRFSDEFGTGVAYNNEDNEGDVIGNLKSQKTSKPSDFQALFGGNNNDHFMIGIKFMRRSIKLFGDFYSSDMIVASPLGLVMKIGNAEVQKEKDVDYLSSIEVLIIDHADVIAMQNWSHVNTVIGKLNHLPSKQHATDIMRIRQWYLDGHAQFYRQTIILGSYLNPEINGLFNHHCVNYQGKVKLVCEHKGVLPKVLLQVRQIYERFDAESAVNVDDARLEYFAKKVFPKIKDSVQVLIFFSENFTQGGIMLFISSYFEFVRVRNFLKSQDASFCLLGEYTKQSDISRARVWFFQGSRKIMLYTERAHFYHRYKVGIIKCHEFRVKPKRHVARHLELRGIQNLIIYSLPERKEFYPEVVNMLEGSHSMTCTVLFSRFDQLRLERIVGTAPAKRMVTSEKGVFVFC